MTGICKQYPSLRNSRRLKEAATRVDEEVAWFRRRARNLTVAECEGDAILQQAVASILRIVSNILEIRHKYLKVVP